MIGKDVSAQYVAKLGTRATIGAKTVRNVLNAAIQEQMGIIGKIASAQPVEKSETKVMIGAKIANNARYAGKNGKIPTSGKDVNVKSAAR